MICQLLVVSVLFGLRWPGKFLRGPYLAVRKEGIREVEGLGTRASCSFHGEGHALIACLIEFTGVERKQQKRRGAAPRRSYGAPSKVRLCLEAEPQLEFDDAAREAI